MEQLRGLATAAGGRFWRDWPASLRYGSKAFLNLEETWRPEEMVITYSYVPIIRLPRFVIDIGATSWLVRESLTICGVPAKSKAWITSTLVAYEGRPTDEVPLSGRDLTAARSALDLFVKGAFPTLVEYYLTVLNEDTESLRLEKPVHFRELERVAETEIVSLASDVDLRDALEVLEERGYKQFRSEAAEGLFPGAREALAFLQWTEQAAVPGDGEFHPGRPKTLAIYAEQPACGSVRALVISRIDATQNRTWYAALTELKQVADQPTSFPLSESTGRFLSMEYGRYF
jgi:hypothetical protein